VNGTTISGYTVLDMQGRVVVSEHQSQLQLLELNSSDFEAGHYIVEVETPYGKVQQKFIIE
jgi:hypothetical protein